MPQSILTNIKVFTIWFMQITDGNLMSFQARRDWVWVGEALALEWSDGDEENRTLQGDKSMERVNGANLFQRTTKTESGRWAIPLNSRAMEAVQHLKAQRMKVGEKGGSSAIATGLPRLKIQG
jgi:integrase